VTGITVPPPGVSVALRVETQHRDPDPPEGSTALPRMVHGFERIPVWQETRWIPNRSTEPRTGVTATFRHTFAEMVVSGTETISTPTDYFRYDLTISEAGPAGAETPVSKRPSRSASRRLSADHAFLMEEQWVARLPEVAETAPGAAPDELIVYYTDMIPFQKASLDPAGRLPRKDIPSYVGEELLPRMVEAFRVQTDDWGFPWHDAWTGHRGGADAERLSVALSDGRTWFHGRARLRADSSVTLRVTGGRNARYDTLTDGLMSAFHHELFHNLQRNINQSYGKNRDLDGAQEAWEFFTEGTAVLASSVGQEDAEVSSRTRTYTSRVNRFLGDGYPGGSDLNRSYAAMVPHRAAIYWRFLYEQCGRTEDGHLDPAAGMGVIRSALSILYSGEVVDHTVSQDLVGALPEIVDRALDESSCPFDSHTESLTGFARAVYALRLEASGRAAQTIRPEERFRDPHGVYGRPPVDVMGHPEPGHQHVGEIPNSFGIDFVEVNLEPTADGRPLTLEVRPTPGAEAAFDVEVLELTHPTEDSVPKTGTGAAAVLGKPLDFESDEELKSTVAQPFRCPLQARKRTDVGGRVFYRMPNVDASETDRLGLIITRIDANECLDPMGAYEIIVW
jgi:hypothetical protein